MHVLFWIFGFAFLDFGFFWISLSSGFDDLYTKPVSKDELVATIRRQIQRVAEQIPVENS